MKKYILPALKLTAITIVFFAVIYPMLIWAVAQLAPNQGKGNIIAFNQKKYYSNIGQSFTEDKYFQSRPSAVNYNASASGASNKGPSNKAYLLVIQSRIDTFLKHNPDVQKSEIPVDLVTASGSGLDPNISIPAAKVQIKRIAKIRNLKAEMLLNLINLNTEKPLLGVFGPEKINVLKLNIALDKISQQNLVQNIKSTL